MPPPLHGHGVLVAGVPIGDAHYVDTVLARIAADTESYISKTVTELRCDPHAAWTSLYYAAQHRFDFFLRHLPPAVTDAYARRLDAAVITAAASLGYAGCLDDPITRRRIRLPARMHGLGLRERAALAPIAYVACFVEAAEACVDRTSLDGAVAAGAFDVLEGLFGPGAFDAGPGAHRFAALVAPNLPRGRVPSADAFLCRCVDCRR